MALIYKLNGADGVEIPRVPGSVKYNGTDVQIVKYGSEVVWDVTNVRTPANLGWPNAYKTRSWSANTVCTQPIRVTITVYDDLSWWYPQDGTYVSVGGSGGSHGWNWSVNDSTGTGHIWSTTTVSWTVPAYTALNISLGGPPYFNFSATWSALSTPVRIYRLISKVARWIREEVISSWL